MYSLIWSTQLYQLKNADCTHYAVFYFLSVNCFGLNGNLIRMQPLEMCSVGAILMLMKADTVSTPLVGQRKTLARPPFFVAGFSDSSPYHSTQQRCPHQRTVRNVLHRSFKHLRPGPLLTQHKPLSSDIILLTHACLTSLTASYTTTHLADFPGPSRLAPLFQKSQRPWGWGVGQHNNTLKLGD